MPLIQFSIIDCDGTLYPETPAFKAHFRACVARAAMDMGVDMPREKLEAVILDSQARYNLSAYRLITEFGLNRIELFTRYNDLLNPDLLPPIDVPRLTSTFNTAAEDASCRAILSYATGRWVRTVLDHYDLRGQFDEQHIVTAEDFEYLTKSESELPIRSALTRLGALPDRSRIYEDSKGALRMAHHIGIAERIFIHGGEPLGPQPEYITAQYATLAEARLVLK